MKKLRCLLLFLCFCKNGFRASGSTAGSTGKQLETSFFSLFTVTDLSFSPYFAEAAPAFPYGPSAADVINIDLLFVMDNSGSIPREDFSKQKTFVARMLDHALTIGCHCSTRVAVITYARSSETKIEFDFDDYSTGSTPRASLKSAVNSILYIGGGSTNTKGALDMAHSLLGDASKGARVGATKVVFVLTDGKSNEGGDPKTAADVLKQTDRATVFAMGVANFQSSSSQQELKDIATPNTIKKDYVLVIDHFDDLRNIAKGFGSKARCNLIDMAKNRPEDWKSIIEGFKILKKEGVIDKLASLHSEAIEANSGAHRGSGFLPWHRAFLSMIERALQIARNDHALRLPYWNWAGEDVATSKIWEYLGGPQDGDEDDKSCVHTGHFKESEWRSNRLHDSDEPRPHCIKRSFMKPDGNLRIPQASQEDLDQDRAITLYKDFRKETEFGPNRHGDLHVKFGAASDMIRNDSPRDPVFYFHHCFIDRLWYDWQKQHGEGPNKYSLSGNPGEYTLNSQMTQLSFSYPGTTTPLLANSSWNQPVNLLNVTALGYTYDKERRTILERGGRRRRDVTKPKRSAYHQNPYHQNRSTSVGALWSASRLHQRLTSSQVLQMKADIQCLFLSDRLSASQMTECVRRRATPGVRLVSGPNKFEGRVEVLINGAWHSICNAGWGDADAAVVCGQLGFSGGRAVVYPKWGYRYNSNLLTSFLCRGNETLLQDCTWSYHWSRQNGYCSNYAYAQVRCSPGVRLTASGRSSGYVQVYDAAQKRWGAVCGAKLWRNYERSMACEAAGYGPSVHQSYHSHSHLRLHPSLATCPTCLVSYRKGIDCSTGVQWGRLYCTNPSDRCYVSCQKAVRLVGGYRRHEGRVEVYHKGAWGTVCGQSWDKRDGDVVCRQMGFSLGAETTYSRSAFYGAGSGIVWLDRVQCVGTESSLDKCRHAGYGKTTCNHDQDAAVKCRTTY